mmetsp:Transcript_78298/g.162650  ORF Transcript_78298/g.162650 Transcript_78298/m.162650 type:complete len:207 (-) Transcript_78298:244-864(-)
MGSACAGEACRLPAGSSEGCDSDNVNLNLVRLNVYDLKGLHMRLLNNMLLEPFGGGVFHCGVEAFGCEWSYGCESGMDPTLSGVYACVPRKCSGHHFRESIDLGWTPVDQTYFKSIMKALRKEWIAEGYNLLNRNCIHFAQELCRRLLLDPLPERLLQGMTQVQRAAGAASFLFEQAKDKAGVAAPPDQSPRCKSPRAVPMGRVAL